MRTVAALPAVGLLAGSVVGFLAPGIIQPLAATLLICGAGAALWAWWIANPRAVATTVAAAFAAAGALLAADAWRNAWRPTLRVAFEELARDERSRAAVERRVLPEDDAAFRDGHRDPPLRRCAHVVRRVPQRRRRRHRRVSAGGCSAGLWSRPRRPARHRRRIPRTFLHRRVARGGTTLVGTVKSGALVELIGYGRWWAERAGSVRLFTRRTISRFVGRWSPQSAAIVTAIVIGDRAGLDDDVQRRLQEAGTYHVIAISGGNIAILAGLLLGRLSIGRVPGTGRDAGRDGRARRLRQSRRRRRVGRPGDVDGGCVLRRPRPRSAEPAVEHAVGRSRGAGGGGPSFDHRTRLRADLWRHAWHSHRRASRETTINAELAGHREEHGSLRFLRVLRCSSSGACLPHRSPRRRCCFRSARWCSRA